MSAYDEVAAWYDGWVSEAIDDDPYFPPVAAFMGEIAGLHICDLADARFTGLASRPYGGTPRE
jgi:hypothetical protein